MGKADLSSARKWYLCLAATVGALGLVLLTCGLVGVLEYHRVDVLPYYAGGLAAGPLALLMAMTSACISMCTRRADNSGQRMAVVRRMVVFQSLVLAVLLTFACILGVVFAVVGGVSDAGYDVTPILANRTISWIILIACLLALGAVLLSFCMYCICAKVFGLTVGPVSRSHAEHHSSVITAQTNTNIVNNNNTFIQQSQTIGANNFSDAHVQSLQQQNQLLQQQIALQQRLIQQQQQPRVGALPFPPAEPPPPYSPPDPGHREPTAPPPSFADSKT
ncbi:uncharacterized protein LOC127845972 [Dreissena polymorpha]|uniref:Uncharacterized protein n=1 Tax=Dreissena polymorpha TaxID=45954 RepID=A0A9D4E182_DREPO|nr:uncharacterized protein LOC127845972 [Dreissena polymorpha]KAH3771924.1 hypothetical protein DPMN_173253 [Dreissena polymorpha]